MKTVSNNSLSASLIRRLRHLLPSGLRPRAHPGAVAVLLAAALTPSAVVPVRAADTLTTIHAFEGTDGAQPAGTPFQGSDGNFYGATASGGAHNRGTVFKITPAGKVTTIYSFGAGPGSTGAEADGSVPNGLFQANDGDFYGTTELGGTNSKGIVFKLTPDGVLTVLHTFSAFNSSGSNGDGGTPVTPLIQGRDGNFYGTTAYGGSNGDGTLFKITPAGAFTHLHSFDGTDGAYPEDAVLQAADGNFYCTTLHSNTGRGTIVELTPAGVFTVRANFGGTPDASYPYSSLLQARDGNFYGTTENGGVNDAGAVYELTPNDTLTVFASFNDSNDTGLEGPTTALIEASDDNFYGTTNQGGPDANGTIYQVTPGHVLTTLYDFTAGADGVDPGGLIQGNDGNLYGMSQTDFAHYGTFFRLNVALPGAVQFNNAIYSVNEFTSPATIRVNRIGGTGPISVHYRTDDESAVAGTDYDSASGTLSWVAGDLTPKYIKVTIRNRGVTNGDLRTLALALSDPTGATSLGHPFTATLTISDSPVPPPAITSATIATAQVGKAFSYQITATNHPTSYGVLGLFSGVTVDQKTGLISGTPTGAGTHTLTLKATNASGTGTKTLTLTVNPSVPVITSAESATATVGKAFSYQIKATNHPTGYGVGGLFKGITVNQQTGLISGTPTGTGTHSLDLRATNAGGTGHETLTLTVSK